ncbi:pyridoxal phosphate-dependent transferase [Elsinoe ampelina]|uniref:Pyridoxal phosphate-dependent transferase n=1 Tax=Elsinoe ampelina TaxID=302913 RepID=A0A6A6GP12_9PEZI|nr:pyridoxal phosphate-dependent transferase [Elsinoe ampelina]
MEFRPRPDYVVSPVSSVDNLPATNLVRPTNTSARRSSQSSRRGRSNIRSSDDRSRGISSPSTTSSEPEEVDYHTDFTTPAASETGPEDGCLEEVEAFREREWPMLKGNVYLDNAGTAIPTASLIRESAFDLTHNLYGNPHSDSAPAARASHKIDDVRLRILRFFNASPSDWNVIFTANATAAIKLVTDCMRDHASATNTPLWYGYHKDSHTSIVGVRELTKMHRCFTSDEEVEIWISSGGLGGPRARQLGLFAYPGQSNMTGRRLPYSWCGRIRKNLRKAKTYTLYDAAAHASTAQMDLSDVSIAPDFVAASFYKIFGKPDIGCLLVRRESEEIFKDRRYFGGGTVEMVITLNDSWHVRKDDLHERLEDGTLPFHSIVELEHALNVHERLFGPMPMKTIGHHTGQLAKMMYDRVSAMRHANGAPVLKIYKDDKSQYGDPSTQGATMAFNILSPKGRLWGFEDVEGILNDAGIYVRSGSLCNPGGMASNLGWSAAEMKRAYEEGHRCSNPVQVLHGKATGVVRASLGAHNIAHDIDRFVKFLEETFIDAHPGVTTDEATVTPQAHSLASSPGSRATSLSSQSTPVQHHTFPVPTPHSLPHRPPSPPKDSLPRNDSALHGLPPSHPPAPTRSTTTIHAPAPAAPSSPSPPPGPSQHQSFSTLTSALSSRSRNRKSLHTRAAKGMGMEIKVHDLLSSPPPNAPPTPCSAEYGGDDGGGSVASASVRSGKRRFGRTVGGLLGRSKG